ncbi:hypothetical protein EJB05_42123, partial [Eragrostis curvula]
MTGSSASTTLQYTGIAVFVAIVFYVVLHYSRSFNTIFITRRHGAGANANVAAGAGDDVVLPGPVPALGLRPDDVAVLPTFTYRAVVSPGRGRGKAKAPERGASSSPSPADCCAVCLDDLRDGALVRMLASCKHYFHAECVDVWLLSHATCPVCRGSPGQEKVRLGVASLSPPLPQLRRLLPEGGEASGERDVVSSSSPSPVVRSPVRFEVMAVAAMGNNGDTALSPSPSRPRTPPVGRDFRTRSPSPGTTESGGAQV